MSKGANENVTIIIPAVREESAKRAEQAAIKNCQGAEVLCVFDHNKSGCPRMVEYLTNKSNTDFIMFLGDDTEIQPGALEAALEEMSKLPDGWGLIGLNTEHGQQNAHWLASKKMLELTGGQFFNTEYQHYYCDNELMDIAFENNKWAWAEKAHVKHYHPSDGKTSPDKIHKDTLPKMEADRKTYVKRKRQRLGKIAIGFPLVDSNIPVQFFTSFCCMDKPSEYLFLLPQFPHGPWAGSIADARNSLVYQAQMDGAKYLLMLDTDQVYPHDTLNKLLSHKKDICGVRVHRRWMPFDPIFYRGELGKYKNVDDGEAFSGKLIEIDATGTGCLLFDMEVFDKVKQPWFEFHHVNGKPVGEDIFFCSKARQEGIRIYVDTSIEVGHLTTMEVNKSLYKLCKPIKCRTTQ